MPSKPQTSANRTEVRVSFDRNLVGVIGDEHYPEAEYLFTELAANAFDADATEIRFTYRGGEEAGDVGGYKLVAEDNGSGMGFEELQSYFTFGSPRKISEGHSFKYHRPLIGRFGLGKVSALKAAKRWFLETEHEGRRFFVDVDFERWIRDPKMAGFKVEKRPATGKNGTRIELVGVRVRGFRHDRIVRAVRRLPLGPKFRVYLNRSIVPARVWDGVASYDIDLEVPIPWPEGERKERVTGAIWIADEPLALEEGKKHEKVAPSIEEVLEDDLDAMAGVEVKVNGATISREFFGRREHGHGVNYLWGYVHADWLPVVANRTDYVRDSDEGDAFYRAMEVEYGQIYNTWRADEKRRAQLRKAAKERRESSPGRKGRASKARKGEWTDRDYNRVGKTIDEVGMRLRAYLEREPTLRPFMGPAPKTRSGRPSETRLNPLFTFSAVPAKASDEDDADETAAETYPEFSVKERTVSGTVQEVKISKTRKTPLARVGTSFASGDKPREVTQPIGNLQVALLPSSDLPKDAAFRWEHDHKGEPVLKININHPLHRAASAEIGSEAHRMYIATIAALALAEQRWSLLARQGINDYVLDVLADVLNEE